MAGTDKASGAQRPGEEAERLLGRVMSRQRWASVGRRFYISLLIVAALYLCLLLVTRLLGVLPDFFTPLSLSAIPLIALSVAILAGTRPDRHAAARAVDRAAGTDDLYLTATYLATNPSDYAPLVVHAADDHSRTIVPKAVVPYRWSRKAGHNVLAISVAAVALYFLPALDPFGYKEDRERHTRRRRELDESRRATEIRRAQLKKVDRAKLSTPVEMALEDLKTTFQQMKPNDQSGNLQRLGKHQQELGKLWRKTGQELLPAKSGVALADQHFGLRSPKAANWSKQLSEGRADAFKKELDELRDLAEKVGKATDRAERERMMRELKRRLQEAGRFASQEMASSGLNSALSRAMEQLNLGQTGEMSKEALEAMMESMDLSSEELALVESAMSDLAALEDALKTLQMAQQCNRANGLDGKGCAGCESLGDYASLYASLMAQGMEGGPGPGMRGPGMGEGGEAPEDNTLETDHKTEKSRSSLTAGKILLQWQIDENADPGTVRGNYSERMREVKQGVDEAIVRERIPPGYHDGIRRYFDKLGVAEKGKEGGAEIEAQD